MSSETEPKEIGQQSNLKRWIPIAIVAVAMVVGYWLDLHEYLTLSSLIRHRIELSGLVDENLILVVLAYFVVYSAAVAVSFPGASFLTIMGGFLFGWFLGGLTTAIAATLGASVIFLAAKTSVGESLRNKAGPRLNRLSEGFRADAFNYLLFLRLVPLFPFWLINIAPALFNVPLRTYTVATFIGILPGTFVYSFIGAGLDSVIEAQEKSNPGCSEDGTCSIEIDALVTTEIIIAIAGLGILAIIPVLLKKFRTRKQETTEEI